MPGQKNRADRVIEPRAIWLRVDASSRAQTAVRLWLRNEVTFHVPRGKLWPEQRLGVHYN